MCGRYARFTPGDLYARLFGAQGELDLGPSYNVAPTQAVLVARNRERGGRELAMLHWGLIPHWAKDPKIGYSTINARAETVATKPMFRYAFRHRRCLIAADGFYEWKRLERSKQPYFIHLREGEPFALAGIWARWEGEEQVRESCAIIVTSANTLVKDIHDRMPVILSPADYEAWMDPAPADPERLLELLKPYPAARMEAYPVSSLVNNPRNNSRELTAELRTV